MSTKRSIYAIWVCLLLQWNIAAQDNYQLGLLPVLNVNTAVAQNYKLNFKTESRQVLYRESELQFDYERVDISLILSRKTGLNNSIAVGYLLSIREGLLVSRSIQQFTITRKYASLRLAHRFSMDQIFEKDEDTAFRIRYRLSNQLPLNGRSVNAKEFYLKVNNEYLNSFQGGDYDLEIRLGLLLGYEFSDNSKIEFGLDQRFDSFIEAKLRKRSWINFAWYVAL